MSDTLNPVQQAADAYGGSQGRTYPGGPPPNPAVAWLKEPGTGLYIQKVLSVLDPKMAGVLMELTTALSELNGTEIAGNGKLDSLVAALVALGPKVDAQTLGIQGLTTVEGTLGIKLDALSVKEQASVDRLDSLITLFSQNLTAQRNSSQSTGFWQAKWQSSGGGDADVGTVAQVDRTVYGLGPSSGGTLLATLATLLGGMADVQLFHVDPSATTAQKAFQATSTLQSTWLGDAISLGANQPLVWLGFGLTLPAGRQLRAHCNAGNVRLNVRVA